MKTKFTFSQDDYFDQIVVKVFTTTINQYHVTTANYKDKYCIGVDTSSIAIIDFNSKMIIKTVKFNNRKISQSYFGYNDSILITYLCDGSVEVFNWMNDKSICKFNASIPCFSSKVAQKTVEASTQKKFIFQHYVGFPLFIINIQNSKRFPEKIDVELAEHDLYFDEENNICFLNTFRGYENRVLNLSNNKILYKYNINKDPFNEDWSISNFHKKSSKKVIQVLYKMSQSNKQKSQIFDEKLLAKFRLENKWANYDTFKIKLWDFESKIYNKTLKTISLNDTINFHCLTNNAKKAIFYTYSKVDFDKGYVKFYYFDIEKGTSLSEISLKYLTHSENSFTMLDSLISFTDTSNILNLFSINQNKIIYRFENVVSYKINNGLIGIIDTSETFTLFNPKTLEILYTKKIGKNIFQFSKDGALVFFFDNESSTERFEYEFHGYERVNKLNSILNVTTRKETLY